MPKRPRPIGTGADRAVIERLREIARPPDELDRLVDDSEAHPDAQLLDLCAEALHLLRAAREAQEARLPYQDGWGINSREAAAWRASTAHAWEESEKLVTRAKPLMRRAGKIRAVTGAGVYGKALLVRASRTGAKVLAKSLAEDLVAIPRLRASLWPAGDAG